MNEDARVDPSMRQSMAALWRGRWLALACAAFAGAIGLVVAEQRGVVRRAKATLHVERPSSVVPDGDLARFREGRGFASAQAALMKSSPTLQRALVVLGDGAQPMFDGVEDRLAFVRRELGVAAGAEDGMLTVTLDAADCATACALVNAVVDAYAARLGEAQQASASTALDALRGDLAQRRAEAADAAAEHRRALETDPSLSLDDESRHKAAAARLVELASAAAQAEATIAAEHAVTAGARACAEAEDPLVATPFAGMDASMRARLDERMRRIDELAARRERLRATVTDEHPDAMRCDEALERERGAAREAARESARVAATAATARAAAASASAAAIEARMREIERGIVEVAPAVANVRALAAQAERARAAAAAIEDRIRSVQLSAAAAQSAAWPQSAMVYERAHPESSAVVRGKSSLVAVAAFAGFVVGVAITWFRAIARPRAHEARDVEGIGAVAAEFPRVAGNAQIDAVDRRLAGPAHAMVARLREVGGGARGGAVCVAGVADDRGSVAVGTALAVAYAEQGDRTLLCDPFAIAAGAHRSDASEAVESLRVSSTTGLWLLDGADRLRREAQSWDGAAQRALSRFADRFDRVVVIAPAVLRSVDTQMLARACGTVVLHGRAGDIRVDDARDAASALRAVGSTRCAFVLHGISSRQARIAAPIRDVAMEPEPHRAAAAPARKPGAKAEGRGDGAMGASA